MNKILITILVTILIVNSTMQIPIAHAAVFTRVQGNTLDSSGTSVTVAFTTQNVATGNLLVLALRVGATATTINVSDNNGNAWTKVASTTVTPGTPDHTLQFWYAANSIATPNAKPTITITSSASATVRALLAEYSGVATVSPLDQNASTTGSGTTPSVTSGATTQASELVLGYSSVPGTATFTPDAAYTLDSVIPAAGNAKVALEYREVSATGTQTPTFTISSQNWGMGVATFNAAATVSLPAAAPSSVDGYLNIDGYMNISN